MSRLPSVCLGTADDCPNHPDFIQYVPERVYRYCENCYYAVQQRKALPQVYEQLSGKPKLHRTSDGISKSSKCRELFEPRLKMKINHHTKYTPAERVRCLQEKIKLAQEAMVYSRKLEELLTKEMCPHSKIIRPQCHFCKSDMLLCFTAQDIYRPSAINTGVFDADEILFWCLDCRSKIQLESCAL